MKQLSLLYGFSGAAALSLEILWFRTLERITGAAAPAVMALLAAWMIGMSAGALWADRVLRGGGPEGRSFLAALHLGLGAWSLLLLPGHGFFGFLTALPPAAGIFGGALFVFPAAFFTGAAFPALAPLLPAGRERAAGLSLLYGVNIIGGVAGIGAVSFAGLELLGHRDCASVIIALCILLAFSFRFTLPAMERDTAEAGGVRPIHGVRPPGPSVGWLAASFAVGSLGLAVETVLVRMLTPVMGLSVYALAGTLIPFLTGLGLGGILARRLARGDTARLFPPVAAAAGLLLGAFSLLYGSLPGLLLQLARLFPPDGIGWGDLLAARAAAALLLLPATICMGALFPLTLILASPASGPDSRSAGRLAAANTLGAALGPVLVQALLIGAVGSLASFRLLAAGYPLAGAVVGAAILKKRAFPTLAAAAVAAGMIAVPPPDPLVLHGGVYWNASRRDEFPGKGAAGGGGGQRRILDSIEGPTAAVLVVEDGPQRYLIIDGKPASNTMIDRPTQTMLARLPLELHGGIRHVLVIGWGSGQTVAEVLKYPVERVVCVEISPEVLAAAPWFQAVNGRALTDGRLEIVVDDGRRYVAAAGEKFDLVISQPSNPWVGFSGALFTEEFFHLARRRLAPGGIMVQWFQAYGIGREDMSLFFSTYGAAFPDWTVWSPFPGDLLLLAARDGGVFDRDRLPGQIRSAYRGSPTPVRRRKGEELNTDDRPVLSFRLARQVLASGEVLDISSLVDGESELDAGAR